MSYYVEVAYPLPPKAGNVRDLMCVKYHGRDITYEVNQAGALIVRCKYVPSHIYAAYSPGNWYYAILHDGT